MKRHRQRNPRGGRFDRCVAHVTRSKSAKNPYAVCAARLKPRRRRRVNPRRKMFSLLARKNGTTLYYVGNKFARHGRPVLFQSLETARVTAKFMRLNYPALRTWDLHAREV